MYNFYKSTSPISIRSAFATQLLLWRDLAHNEWREHFGYLAVRDGALCIPVTSIGTSNSVYRSYDGCADDPSSATTIHTHPGAEMTPSDTDIINTARAGQRYSLVAGRSGLWVVKVMDELIRDGTALFDRGTQEYSIFRCAENEYEDNYRDAPDKGALSREFRITVNDNIAFFKIYHYSWADVESVALANA